MNNYNLLNLNLMMNKKLILFIFFCLIIGPYFRRMPFEERQKALKDQYRFDCKCKPCTDPDLKQFLVSYFFYKKFMGSQK